MGILFYNNEQFLLPVTLFKDHYIFNPLWWLILCVNLDRLQCPVVWSNIILDIAVKVFFDVISIQISRLWIKQINPP